MAFKDIRPKTGHHVDLSSKDRICIFISGDQHIGCKAHDSDFFQEMLEDVQTTRNSYMMVQGDAIEAVPPNYKIPERAQTMSIDEQKDEAVRLFTPIRKKIIQWRSGNHCKDRTMRTGGVDSSRDIALRLDVPYYDLPGYTYIKTAGGGIPIMSGHGTRHSKANMWLEHIDIAKIYRSASLIVLGHTHDTAVTTRQYFVWKGRERCGKQYWARSGCMMGIPDYAKAASYEPKPPGYLRVLIEGGQIQGVETITKW